MTDTTREAAAPRRRRAVSARRILVAAVAAQCGISFAEQGLPTLSVFIKQDLGLSGAAAGAVVAASGVGRIVAFYAGGIAVDRRGERRVLLVGAVGTGLCVMAAAGLPYVAMLVALLFAGVFLAVVTTAGGKLVFTAFRPERRGLAMGIRQAGVPIGGLAAAALLPLVAGALGWRAALVLAGAVSVLGGAAVVGIAGLGPRVDAPDGTADRSIAPFLNRDFLLVAGWGCPLVAGQYALLTFLAIDAHARTGISTGAAATLVLVIHAGGIVGRVAWGALADARPELRGRAVFVALAAAGVAATLGLGLVPPSVPSLVVLGLLAGLSVNGWQGLWLSRLQEVAGTARAGAGTGLALTFLALSFTITTPVFGGIADAAGTTRAIWFAVAGVLGVACLMALCLPETEPLT